MLAIRDLHLSIQGRKLLEGAQAVVPSGHRVGVVGRNGSGKTTLFRAIRGEIPTDGGELELPKNWRIGGVAQEAPASQDSLIEIVLAADVERAALLREAEASEDPMRIAEVQTRLADIDAHSAEARAAAILRGLGFDAADQSRPAAEFSGGWRMRVSLAGALFAAPDLLLLDEPTNYLDLEGALWLENFLARYPRTVLLISHDRGLLNRSVGAILHLSEKKLTLYNTPYDQFAAQRRERIAQIGAQAKRQATERDRIQGFVDRFRAKASKARQAQARLKMLEKMEPIAAVVEESVAPFSFPEPEELSPPILTLEDASVGYDGAPVLRDLSLRIDQDDRIALLGANGQGKSTLSKLLAGLLPLMAGRRVASSKLRIGFFAQHQLDGLVPHEDAIAHIRRLRPEEPPAKLRARLGAAGVGADIAETPAEKLSGGQKARLLMALATLDAPHLLILDEPTNHLDIESRDALVQALTAYSGAVILVSHDADLVEATADRLWLVGGGGVAPFEGDMADYRRLLLSRRGSEKGRDAPPSKPAAADEAEKPAPAKPKQARRRSHAELRKSLAPLRAEAFACEERVKKLEAMRELVAQRLGDPTLYQSGGDTLEGLGRKRAEIEAGLERAEALWLEALEKLEQAEAELEGG